MGPWYVGRSAPGRGRSRGRTARGRRWRWARAAACRAARTSPRRALHSARCAQTRASCPTAPPPMTPAPAGERSSLPCLACPQHICRYAWLMYGLIRARQQPCKPRPHPANDGCCSMGSLLACSFSNMFRQNKGVFGGRLGNQNVKGIDRNCRIPLQTSARLYVCLARPHSRDTEPAEGGQQAHRAVPGHQLDELAAPVDADEAHVLLHPRQVEHAPPRPCRSACPAVPCTRAGMHVLSPPRCWCCSCLLPCPVHKRKFASNVTKHAGCSTSMQLQL